MRPAHYKATCSTNCLPGIREFVRAELTRMKVTGDAAAQLVLAIDEACTNNIIHQHRNDGTTTFDLYLTKKANRITVEIKDKGTPFPIHKYKPQELQILVQKKVRGGLGIMLITKIMDEIEVVEKKDYFIYRFVKRV